MAARFTRTHNGADTGSAPTDHLRRRTKTNSDVLRQEVAVRSLTYSISILTLVCLFAVVTNSATVTNTNDSGAGSLRNAIANAAPGDTIDFSVTGTITLTSGQLVIDKYLTIQGPGQELLSISGNNASRVFSINAGVTAELVGLTIKGGYPVRENGGGVVNYGTLTILNSTISDNTSGPDNVGGGIYNSGTLTVINTTVSRNYLDPTGYLDNIPNTGGGIYNAATMFVRNSTVSENIAFAGGGIYNRGTTSVSNSSISGNIAIYDSGGYGGGILNYSGTLNVSNSTITGNIADGSLSYAIGGGIFISDGLVMLSNTIVAGNIIGDIVGPIASAHHNLIGDAAWSGGITNGVNGNIVGVAPMLGPLADNGGPTQTHALLPNSPAIDKGKAFGLLTDQRGFARPFNNPQVPNSPGGDGSDIGAFEQQVNEAALLRARFDFDGDGRSDISVFRPSDRTWYLDRSTDGFAAVEFGLPTDQLAPADFDGDLKTDISVFRDGVWWRINSSDGTVVSEHFGIAGDIPVPADYTGDGRAELAVYRDGAWWTFDLSNNQSSAINFGLATDKPVPADYDGDGRTDQAVYRNGEWHLNRSSQGYTIIHFGLGTDTPVVGDYDGDARSDPAVYRTGTWYILGSTQGFSAYVWGLSTDTPVAADYDGDGRTDPSVYRDGTWYLLRSTGGVSVHQFGVVSDEPVAAAYMQ